MASVRRAGDDAATVADVDRALAMLHRLVHLHGDVLDGLTALSSADSMTTRAGGLEMGVDAHLSVDTVQPVAGQFSNSASTRRVVSSVLRSVEERLVSQVGAYKQTATALSNAARTLDATDPEPQASSTSSSSSSSSFSSALSSSNFHSASATATPARPDQPIARDEVLLRSRELALADVRARNARLSELLSAAAQVRDELAASAGT